MYFDKIIYGVQYYRAPTPLPGEWDTDLSRIAGWLNADTVQLRVQWRQNEPRENEYDFTDIDNLLDLAEKYKLKVIFKFLLENAPQYVFDKYNGYRIGSDGTVIRSGSHGAFYVGGWLPCFCNPRVREAAERFVSFAAKRYKNNRNIILWNAWNEPVNRPAGECFCSHCRRKYGIWLKDKYGTIENFNGVFGVKEESFETIQLPAMTHGYWDVFLFKKWKSGAYFYDLIKAVKDKIREQGITAPVMCHCGVHSGMQSDINMLADDYEISKAVDFYGSSFSCAFNMEKVESRWFAQFLADFMRSVDKNFFIHEVYPGIGLFRDYDSPEEMSFKLWSILSAGAKGIVFWQYRAERLGCENDCAGLVNIDGTNREVTRAVKSFGEILIKNQDLFTGANPLPGDVAILMDYDSLLISVIEDGNHSLFNLASDAVSLSDGFKYYTKAHQGGYRLFTELGFRVDYLTFTQKPGLKQYKVLYLPNYEMADESIQDELFEFVNGGGVLIADEGFALRDRSNTWLRAAGLPFPKIFNAKLKKRRLSGKDAVLRLGSDAVTVMPYLSWFETDGKVLARFSGGEGAVFEYTVGKGKVVLFGVSIGYSYGLTGEAGWRNFIDGYLKAAVKIQKQRYADALNGIYHRTLRNGRTKIELVQNWSGRDAAFDLPDCRTILTGQAIRNGKVVVGHKENLCFTATE